MGQWIIKAQWKAQFGQWFSQYESMDHQGPFTSAHLRPDGFDRLTDQDTRVGMNERASGECVSAEIGTEANERERS